jgi:hypothetical protein
MVVPVRFRLNFWVAAITPIGAILSRHLIVVARDLRGISAEMPCAIEGALTEQQGTTKQHCNEY